MLILLELFSIFGRTKFIINSNKARYKISTMVAFCPGGLLSGVGIFSGLLSGGLMSGGLLSVHRRTSMPRRLSVPGAYMQNFKSQGRVTSSSSLPCREKAAP